MGENVDAQRPEEDSVERASALLAAGGVIAYPTETFYALGASVHDPSACARVFAIKGRNDGKALPCIVSDLAQLAEVALDLTPNEAKLATRFWPGPLTLIVRARRSVVAASSDGTLAARVSSLPIARRLAQAAGPLTSTSANLAGEPPAASAPAVERTLGALVDLVLDGGDTAGGLASTIIDASGDRPALLRAGPVSFASICEELKS